MLVSEFLGLAIISSILTVLGLSRFFYDWRHADLADTTILFISFLLDLVTAQNAYGQDIVNPTATSVSTSIFVNAIQSNAWMVAPFYAFTLICFFLGVLSVVVYIPNSVKARRKEFVG